MPSPLARHWTLDPNVDYLNHGSFGACPEAVLEWQARLRAELERQPVEFYLRRLPDRFDAARDRLAAFLGAEPDDLVAVPNATTGVNTVLASVPFGPDDELLVTDHEYNACRNAIDRVATRSGARVVVVALPFPGTRPEDVVARILAAATERTRLALLDHVTSPTGLVLPLASVVRELSSRGIDTLVDGAHAPGMLPLELGTLGAAYYTGNCHKWLCAPKGAAFLHVRRDRHDVMRPLVTSHGYNMRREGRSRLHDEFDWPGTVDPTPFLCVPRAIETMAGMVEGGWPEIRRRNHALALEARALLVRALGVEDPAPDSMIGSLVALPLPPSGGGDSGGALYSGALQLALVRRHGIEVPVVPWPAPPARLLRISAQLYNDRQQYERLAAALRTELADAARQA